MTNPNSHDKGSSSSGHTVDQNHSKVSFLLRNLISYTLSRCLIITEKVSFNIAGEASYVYISGQKLPKNGPFWRVFEKPEACGQTVLPDRSVLIGQKLVENAKILKLK